MWLRSENSPNKFLKEQSSRSGFCGYLQHFCDFFTYILKAKTENDPYLALPQQGNFNVLHAKF